LGSTQVFRQTAEERDVRWQMLAAFERAAAVFLFAAAFPLLLVSSVVIALQSRRVPWIAHKRVGWQGSTLWMLKLRTMWDERPGSHGWIEYIDDHRGPGLKHEDDPRVAGRFARFCRRHSIDELPQLWHVIQGEMSLVGPRPMTLSELQRYYGDDAEEILQVKPGLAGLWQTSGRNRLTYAERRRMDLQWVRERSAGMYLVILLRTIPEVWRGENSW
jgi:exopolysaccharide production protein ExoY